MNAGGTFAGYRLELLLATDTVSSIYRATPLRAQRTRPRPVALRVTHPLSVADGPDVEAIATYIRRLSEALKVNHPALAPIADAGDTDDRVYVATALIDGVTLAHHIRDHGRATPPAAVELLRGLANGLDRVHAAGIVHGAVSSRTILIRNASGSAPSAVLRGFGIDTLLARQARLDRDRIDIRDVEYVAPEQLHGAAVDGRADQYALACALHHCIAGAPPFTRETASGMFGAHLFSEAARVPVTDDPALLDALRTGLAKRAAERYASCRELLRATGQLTAPVSARRSTAMVDATDDPPVVWADTADDDARAGDAPGGRVPAAVDPPSDARSTSPSATPAHHWEIGGRLRRTRTPRWPRRRPARVRAARGWIGHRSRGPIVTWPIAAMMVLTGIVSTLALVSMARRDAPVVAGRVPGGLGEAAAGSLAASGDAPASAGVGWQRTVSDEAPSRLHVVDGTVVAAAPHTVVALDDSTGATVWRHPIDVGVLTDLAVASETVALRAATFRALALETGTRQWDKADIVAPISALTARDGVIYGMGPGRLTPELVALDAATGEAVWHYDGGAEPIADDTSVVAGDGVVAMLDSDDVVVVDAAGPTSRSDDGRVAIDSERWRVDVVRPWLDSLAVLPDAVIIASRTGQVCAYDPADGALRWCAVVEGLDERRPALVADGDTIAVVLESKVTALALESGTPRWTFAAPRPLTRVAASTGSQLVVSDVRGRAYGLDLDRGFEAWRASGFGGIAALAASTDAVYAGTRNGLIVRLDPPVDGVPS